MMIFYLILIPTTNISQRSARLHNWRYFPSLNNYFISANHCYKLFFYLSELNSNFLKISSNVSGCKAHLYAGCISQS